MRMDPEITEEPSVLKESAKPKFVLTKKMTHIAIALGVIVSTFAIMTSFVYRHSPTDSSVRKIVGIVPYPAEIIGNHIITLNELAEEREQMDTYLQMSGTLDAGSGVDERAVDNDLLDTIEQKFVIRQIADARGVVLDDARVEEYYTNAMGGGDPVAFADQINKTFGWTTDEFKERIIKPVVLATMTNESIASDAGRQAEPSQKAQAAYDRIASGEDFATVAGEASEHPSATTGGDVGEMAVTDIPADLQESIAAIAVGDYSGVIDGKTAYLIFKVTARSGKGMDEKVSISLISVQKTTLNEAIEEYMLLHRNWRFLAKS